MTLRYDVKIPLHVGTLLTEMGCTKLRATEVTATSEDKRAPFWGRTTRFTWGFTWNGEEYGACIDRYNWTVETFAVSNTTEVEERSRLFGPMEAHKAAERERELGFEHMLRTARALEEGSKSDELG